MSWSIADRTMVDYFTTITFFSVIAGSQLSIWTADTNP